MTAWLDWPLTTAESEAASSTKPAFDVGIIGGGISGACLATHLATKDLQIGLFAATHGCSAQIPALLVRPYPEASASPSHRLYQHAYQQAQSFYAQHCPQSWAEISLDTPKGTQSAGILHSATALATLQSHHAIQTHSQTVLNAQQQPGGWQLTLENGQTVRCKQLALCCAQPPDWLDLYAPISPCSGQVIALDQTLARAFSHRIHGIALGEHSQIGSSYRPGDAQATHHADDAQALLTQAKILRPELQNARMTHSHAGVRQVSLDHLPLIGPAPDMSCWALRQQQHENRRNQADKPTAPYLPGLWLNLAQGSRGATMAPLAAQLLSAGILGSSPTLPADLLQAIHPGRFATRATRRGTLEPSSTA